MSYLDVLNNKKQDYKNNYNNAARTASLAQETINELYNLKTKENEFLQYDENQASGSTLDVIIEKQRNIISNINNNILPSINNKLDSLEDEIDEEMARVITEGGS